MSLRQKIGQLMMFGFTGTEPSSEILKLIKEDYVGGLILFSRNIGTAKEVLQLTDNLQSAAKKADHAYPLLISIDEENGIVRRLGEGTTIFPGNMLLGAVGDTKATELIAESTAKELSALGINMNLAPVLDINNNPLNPVIGVRSFGESAEDVTSHGIASIKGHHTANVITTVKHFPGHGDTDTDSHLDLPTIPYDLERLMQVELVPFQHSFSSGADCVMIAHVYFSALEADNKIPATISKAVVTDLLREKMGFDGVITTDCLEMNAISKTIGTAEGALQALKAGVDMLMISHSHTLQHEAIERIVTAVDTGEITEERINQSVERIVALKKKYVAWDKLPNAGKELPSFIGGKEHQDIAKKQFERGVTLVKNQGILPLKVNTEDKILVIYPQNQVHTMVEDERTFTYSLGDVIRNYHEQVVEYSMHSSPTQKELEEVKKLASDVKTIIVGTVNAHMYTSQAQLVNTLLENGKHVITIGMRNPYDLIAIPNVNAFLAIYEHSIPALEAAAAIVFGKRKPYGKLPVTIPGYAEKGFGLTI